MSSYTKNIDNIWDKGLCTQCGTCAGVCPVNAITMDRDKVGNYIPSLDPELCNHCETCAKVCPGNFMDFRALNNIIFGDIPKDLTLGNYKKCYVGHALDKSLLESASSGGIISSLLIFALEKGIIDGAIVTRLNQNDPFKPEVIIARTKEDIHSTAGSKYIPVPLNIKLNEIIAEKGKFAIVGLPCHIQGIRKAEEIIPELKEKINLHISLFCSHTNNLLATKFQINKWGIKMHDIAKIEYRAGRWPGKVQVLLKNSKENMEINFMESDFKCVHKAGFFAPVRCTLCCDVVGELSDISVGDAWLDEFTNSPQGESIIMSRTEEGEQVINQAIDNKYISVLNINPKKVEQSQSLQLHHKKRNIVARMKIRKALGKHVPVVNSSFLKPSKIGYIGAFIQYICIFIMSKKIGFRVLSYIPSSIIEYYSKILKL